MSNEQAVAFLEKLHYPDLLYIQPAVIRNKNPHYTRYPDPSNKFVAQIKSLSPKTKIFALINMSANSTVGAWIDFTDSNQVGILTTTIAQFVIANGFDGAYLDIEPVTERAAWYISLIQQLRTKMPDKSILSYGFRITNTPRQSWGWTPDYFREVARMLDYIELSTYNTSSLTVSQWQAFLAYQSNKVDELGLNNVIFILPAYAATSIHNPAVENIGNATSIREKNTSVFSEAYMTDADWTAYAQFIKI